MTTRAKRLKMLKEKLVPCSAELKAIVQTHGLVENVATRITSPTAILDMATSTSSKLPLTVVRQLHALLQPAK